MYCRNYLTCTDISVKGFPLLQPTFPPVDPVWHWEPGVPLRCKVTCWSSDGALWVWQKNGLRSKPEAKACIFKTCYVILTFLSWPSSMKSASRSCTRWQMLVSILNSGFTFETSGLNIWNCNVTSVDVMSFLLPPQSEISWLIGTPLIKAIPSDYWYTEDFVSSF